MQTNIFNPFVTIEQILAFEPGKPETYTESRFLNALMLAYCDVGYGNMRALEQYFGMKAARINHGVQIVCGFSHTFLKAAIVIKKYAAYKANPKGESMEHFVERLGLGDRSTINAMIHNRNYRHVVQLVNPELLKNRDYRHYLKFKRRSW